MGKERRPDPFQLDREEIQVLSTEPVEMLRDELVTLRRALRDCLAQVGVPSNPAWTDENIVHAIAQILNVENHYSEAAEITRRMSPHTRRYN